jgi:hypothetical protein
VKTKNKAKIVTSVSLAVAAVSLLTTGAMAFFSDAAVFETQSGKVGTVSISDTNLLVTDNTGKSATSFGTWNPGDINTITWRVENTGTKSIATRNRLYIYWEDEMNEYSESNDIVYLYPQNVSNNDIEAEMLAKDTKSKIDIGSPKKITVNGKEYTGWEYICSGDILDGVGTDAETGDAFETDYASNLNDMSSTYDSIAYKIALSNYANVHTMDKNLKVVVITEAMQARNTADSEWETVSVKEISVSAT